MWPKSLILTEVLSLTKLKSGSSEFCSGVGPDRGLCPYSSGSAFLVQFQQESCCISLSKIPHSQHLITLAKILSSPMSQHLPHPRCFNPPTPTLLLGYKLYFSLLFSELSLISLHYWKTSCSSPPEQSLFPILQKVP